MNQSLQFMFSCIPEHLKCVSSYIMVDGFSPFTLILTNHREAIKEASQTENPIVKKELWISQ